MYILNMPRVVTMEILQLLEDKLGKEEGRKIAQAIEIGLEVIEKKSVEVSMQRKLELRDELTKELTSKADILLVRQEMQTIKTELEGKIAKLDQKFNFMIILMIIALTLMNPVAAEIIKRFLKMS